MRNVALFIAMSLDGYIADQNGEVGWLAGEDTGGEDTAAYDSFFSGIDTVIMGWTTYHQIVTELSPDRWVYQGLQSYVITHREMESTEEIRFTRQAPADLVRSLRQAEGKGIWICGGAQIVRQLMQEDLIDTYHLSMIPVILGRGIRLFAASDCTFPLRLKEAKTYHGITDLIYDRRQP